MIYTEYPPSNRLQRFLKCFWTLEGDSDKKTPWVGQFLTDGGMDISFNLKAPVKYYLESSNSCRIPETTIIGALSKSIWIVAAGRTRAFGFRFKPGYAFHFLRAPVDAFADGCFDFNDIFGSSFVEWVSQIHRPDLQTAERISILEDFLIKHMWDGHEQDVMIEAVVDRICAVKGKILVKELARATNLSPRHLERKFKEFVGLTPKHLCRIVRFQNTFDFLRMYPNNNWVSTAISGGYYDQSHFINDCKYFTGYTPEDYFLRKNGLKNICNGNNLSHTQSPIDHI